MYPAKNGDAFLLKSSQAERCAILIDGGFCETYRAFIKPDIEAIAATGFRIDLVIASHIDADHVGGLLEFFKNNGHSSTPELIEVGVVWHNSVRSISAKVDAIAKYDLPIVQSIAQRGYPSSEDDLSIREISATQGSSLAALLLAGQYKWNEGSGQTCIETRASLRIRKIGAAHVEVLGPSRKRLLDLEAWWKSELRRRGFASEIGAGDYFDDAFEFLVARSELLKKMTPAIKEISRKTPSILLSEAYAQDESVTNASSISVEISLEGKKFLFLGDCLAEDLVDVLRTRAIPGERLWFDAIKISHHGSVHNTSPDLLSLIDSDTYLISSNGDKHGHPDFPVLKAIVDRPSTFLRSLHFNYSTPASRQLKTYVSESGSAFSIHENSTSWLTFS